MRNTLRLLGIIALVALIGFGLIACNDGSTVEEKEKNETPIEDDFDYLNFKQVWDGDPKYVSIIAKSGRTTGAVDPIYNDTVGFVPKEVGTYKVTFNVAAAPGWNFARTLTAPTFEIVTQDLNPVVPTADEFTYEGLGSFKYLPVTPRGVVITPKYDLAVISNVTYNGRGAPYIPTTKDTYNIKFHVSAGAGHVATDIEIPAGIVIYDGEPVSVDDYLVSGQSQLYQVLAGDPVRRELKVIPKIGKSKGERTFWYQSDDVPNYYIRSLLTPWEKGKYNVTMDVAEKDEFEPKFGIPIGTLEIGDKGTGAKDPKASEFNIEAYKLPADNFGGSYDWDNTEKGLYITEAGGSKGRITFYYTEIDSSGNPDYTTTLEPDTFPTEAGEYQLSYTVDESIGYNVTPAYNAINALKAPRPLAIVPIKPLESDFTVRVGDVINSNNPPVFIERYVPIGKSVEIGPYTFKNINYPVAIKYKGRDVTSWLDIYYKDQLEIDGLGNNIGPINAGNYPVTFSLKFSRNFLTVGSAEVGTMVINKAKPTKEHYNYSDAAATATYLDTGTWIYPTITKNGNFDTDGFVVSNGTVTVKYDGTSYAAAVGGPKKANPDGYKVTIDVAAPTAEPINWLAAEGIELGTWKVAKAALADADVTVENKDYHIQSAYNVRGIKDVLKYNGDKIKSANVYYSKVDFGDPTGANWSRPVVATQTDPQIEGRYYVAVQAIGDENHNDRWYIIPNGFVVPEGTPELDAEFLPYGLVVNPLIIRNMIIFKNWLEFVNPRRNDDGFKDVKEYNVVFVLGTDDDLRGPFNSSTYGFNTAYGTESSFIDLVKAYPELPLHLNFGFDEEENALFTTFAASTTGIVTIPDETFLGIPNIKKVTFPEGDFVIGEDAFKDCSGLAAVPNNVSVIGDGAFRGTAITTLELTTVLTTIGNFAFADLAKFTTIIPAKDGDLPDDYVAGTPDPRDDVTPVLETIGANAFQNTGIATLVIPDSLESIGEAAFDGCVKLWKVQFGENEITFGEDAFPGDLVEKFGLSDTGGSGVYTRDERPDGFTESWTNQNNPNVVVLP
jgi:hypothetical protein